MQIPLDDPDIAQLTEYLREHCTLVLRKCPAGMSVIRERAKKNSHPLRATKAAQAYILYAIHDVPVSAIARFEHTSRQNVLDQISRAKRMLKARA